VIPEPYQFVLLALIAYRLWRLIAEDDVLEGPRRRLVRLPRNWRGASGDRPADSIPSAYRETLALWLTCPWCAGAWVCLVVYGFWMATVGEWPDTAGDVTVAAGIWFALSALVGFQRAKLDPPE
jgi:hypothetical protein